MKSPHYVSFFASQRLLRDITMKNYLAAKFVRTKFSVSTLLRGFLLADQFYNNFCIVLIILSYLILYIMSVNTNTMNSDKEVTSRRSRLRLWNPRPSDECENDTEAPKVVNDEPLNDEIYLPEDRPQVDITNAIRHEDLPQCRPLSECHDIHPADPIVYDVKDHGQNYRHRIFHEKWTEPEAKVFSNKYVNLQSNKEKKFDLMAKALTQKTSTDCRQFYYLYKHILDFKKPERERKQIEKERKESLLRLKEPCSSRLRSGRKQESQTKTRVATTPSKNFNLVKGTQTSRPMFVRNDVQAKEQCSEVSKDVQITEESGNVPLASLPFTAPKQENNLSRLSDLNNLSNLNLLAQVCIDRPQLELQSSTSQNDQVQTKSTKETKPRKRSRDEVNLSENTSTEEDCKQKTKKCCLDNVRPAMAAAIVVKSQEKTPSKDNGKKRKRQEISVDDVTDGQKKTRLGRPIKRPSRMDL